MRTLLLESGRSFLHASEWALVSLVAHAGVVWIAVDATAGGRQLPADQREARVFFLLPPDRVDVRIHQTDAIQWGRIGSDMDNGRHLTRPGEGLRLQEQAYGARQWGERSGARGQVPFGPAASLVPDTVFSVLEVDETVERFDGSAAPVYPRELLALGMEGLVQAEYVVDSTGRVDSATIEVLYSDDPRFTESVRTALGLMRFRPARRGGKAVRQSVAQKFRFRIQPPSQSAGQVG